MKRTILIFAAALAAIFLFLLASASGNTSLFARHFPLLVVINVVVVLCLIGLVGWQVRELSQEYRARVFGSRLKLRLMLMFGALAVLPGILVYGVSMQFVTRSIETWFNVRVETALSSGLALGRKALDSLLDDLVIRGESMASDLSYRERAAYPDVLRQLRGKYGVSTAMLLNRSGKVVVADGASEPDLEMDTSDLAQLGELTKDEPYARIESNPDGGMALRVMVYLGRTDSAEEPMALLLVQPAPESLAKDAEAVQAVYRDYEQLLLARRGLTQIYGATLTLTVLLAVSAAFALAFFFTRRLSAPLSVLVEGTQAVAQGDFSPRQAIHSGDELGVLTQSFNRMTRQLDDARNDADRHRADLEASRAYLESILANLSAGVLVFDHRFMLRHYNEGACKILADDFEGLPGATIDAWPRQMSFGSAIQDGFANATDDWQVQLELVGDHEGGVSGMPQFLLLRGSRLPDAAGDGGFVVVFDDISGLVAAQRSAAWGEVARRLAHEIKNPLTPIQLSAERLQQKLAPKLDRLGVETLNKSVGTIVRQVQAMKQLVNDFRDYAPVSQFDPAPLDINDLITEILGLYEYSTVKIQPHLCRELPLVMGDSKQLRQVVHNLLRNAEDALTETKKPQLDIYTELMKGRARFSVIDNGPGFPASIMARAFEPYVTTKQRGSGLGLAIVQKIIDEHQGSVVLNNVEPHGARIVIELPLANAS